MLEKRLYYPLSDLHNIDATLDESDSYYFLQSYIQENYLHYRYSYPDIYTLEEISNMINNFSLFFSKIKDVSGNSFSSPVPINVFRFMLLEDMSFSSYYTIKRKPGYVVEGAYWSNGMFYSVREDKLTDFETYQIVLYLDSLTKTLHNYP
jgi:hypothetical protein